MDLFSGAANMTVFIFQDMLPPDFSAIGAFIAPALDTLYMSYIGLFFSVFFSLVFGVMAARTTAIHPIAAFLSRSFITFLRSIPAIVWGILLVAAIGLGPLAGTIALGMSGIGILGRAFADLLEEIDQNQTDAVRATGANWFQIIGQGVWPQFKPGFISWSLYKMDLNIREAAVLGVVGAGGIGYALESSISLFQYREATVGILMIFMLILCVEFTTAKIREKIL
jgi:phosphonate transport system permease protein